MPIKIKYIQSSMGYITIYMEICKKVVSLGKWPEHVGTITNIIYWVYGRHSVIPIILIM